MEGSRTLGPDVFLQIYDVVREAHDPHAIIHQISEHTMNSRFWSFLKYLINHPINPIEDADFKKWIKTQAQEYHIGGLIGSLLEGDIQAASESAGKISPFMPLLLLNLPQKYAVDDQIPEWLRSQHFEPDFQGQDMWSILTGHTDKLMNSNRDWFLVFILHYWYYSPACDQNDFAHKMAALALTDEPKHLHDPLYWAFLTLVDPLRASKIWETLYYTEAVLYLKLHENPFPHDTSLLFAACKQLANKVERWGIGVHVLHSEKSPYLKEFLKSKVKFLAPLTVEELDAIKIHSNEAVATERTFLMYEAKDQNYPKADLDLKHQFYHDAIEYYLSKNAFNLAFNALVDPYIWTMLEIGQASVKLGSWCATLKGNGFADDDTVNVLHLFALALSTEREEDGTLPPLDEPLFVKVAEILNRKEKPWFTFQMRRMVCEALISFPGSSEKLKDVDAAPQDVLLALSFE